MEERIIEAWEVYEEIIKEKGFDDDSFDLLFAVVSDNYFFDPPEVFIEPFWEFSYELNTLYRFYEYTWRHINGILKEQQHAISMELKRDSSAETADMYDELLSVDKSYLPEISHQTVLLMLYTIFENLLRRLVEFMEANTGRPFDKRNNGNAIINKYLEYLKIDCAIVFKLSKDEKELLTLMRKTRNYFVHDLHGVGAINLKRYARFSPIPIIRDGRLYIGYDYVISCFELIGAIVSKISDAMIDCDSQC